MAKTESPKQSVFESVHGWVFIFNVIGLLVCYFLTEYTEVTFHCETHDWLRPRENLQIACWSLAGLGLLSCVLTEVHIRTNPIEKIVPCSSFPTVQFYSNA